MKTVLIASSILAGQIMAFNQCFSQDQHFSQYNFSPLTLNPALTCAYKNIQGTLQHRQQWGSLNGYVTSAATFEMKLNQGNWVEQKKGSSNFSKKAAQGLAFGINIFSDGAGDGNLKHTQANLSMAYHLLLNDNNTLSAGLMGGIVQRSISPEGLRWNSQYIPDGTYDPTLASGEDFARQSFVYGDYAMGIVWSYGDGSRYLAANDQKHFNVGMSYAHFTHQVNYSFLSASEDVFAKRFILHANALYGIENTSISIGPSFMHMRQHTASTTIFGSLMKYNLKEESKYTGHVKAAALSGGLFYRYGDAIVPVCQFEINDYLIGVSYDINVSKLAQATSGRGGIEIVLRYNSPSSFLYQNKSRY